jgi:hypothetical protein
MRRVCLIVVLAAVGIEMSAAMVSAQMVPGHRRRSSGYDSDAADTAVGLYALANSNNAARSMAQGYQAWRQQPLAGVPSGAGNFDADGQRQVQALNDQRQANRDWWFQTQQQQVTRRQMAEAASAGQPQPSVTPPLLVPSPQPQDTDALRQDRESQWESDQFQRQYDAARWQDQLSGFESSPSIVPVAATDVIRWLPALQGPQFAGQRARIEAPYRRSAKGLSTPTAKDYQDMIDATGKMKAILKATAGYLTAQDYLDAEAFLDRLAAEARDKLDKGNRSLPVK